MKKLTEKDAIWCKTQNQWDSIIEMFGSKENLAWINFEKQQSNGLLFFPYDKVWTTRKGHSEKRFTIHKAKDILNNSFKKDVLKRLDNLEEERKNENPIELLEKLLSEITPKESLKIKKDMISLALKGEPLKFDLPTKELEELPEKWCVCRDYKTALVINDWFNTLKKPTTLFTTDKGYVCSDKSALEFKIPEGYTEITFDQFKKWVLKEDDLTPVEKMLDESQKPLSIREVQVKVTSQRQANECAEIAKACGESIGNKFSMCFEFPNEYFLINEHEKFGVYEIVKNKKVISIQEYRERFGKKQETEIDWSKSGQFVESENETMITQKHKRENQVVFTGVCVKKLNENGFEVGDFSDDLLKECFKLCTEPITLKNE